MTLLKPWLHQPGMRGIVHQVLIVILINIPTVSFGLAFGWVSLVSGKDGNGEEEAVVAAVTTFTAALAGVPLSAYAISIGRRFAIIATSFLFVICWSLKLATGSLGVAGVVCARVAAGLGCASAWALAPLLAREMCSEKYRGAAVTALPLMHNVGILLMYLAADAALPQSTILWLCLGVSVVHCCVTLFMPESPSFLAAHGKPEEAQKSLAWLRGVSPDDPALTPELQSLPLPEPYERSPYGLAKEMLRDRRRRRAFIISTIAVVGQEMCGILSIMQYAERVFILAEEKVVGEISDVVGVTEVAVKGSSDSLLTPARHAVVLGSVQLIFSIIALYLVERVGRRPLLVWCATLTGGALAISAGLVRAGTASGAAIGLAVAVATDAAGLQPTPYSLLAEMFDYEYRGCALMLATAVVCIGNTVESAIFPVAVAAGGLTAALALGAAITLAYAVFVAWTVPETKGRTPEEIYQLLIPTDKPDCETGKEPTNGKTAIDKCNKIMHIINDAKYEPADKPHDSVINNLKHCYNEKLQPDNLIGSNDETNKIKKMGVNKYDQNNFIYKNICQSNLNDFTKGSLNSNTLQAHSQDKTDESAVCEKNAKYYIKNISHLTRESEDYYGKVTTDKESTVMDRLDRQTKDKMISDTKPTMQDEEVKNNKIKDSGKVNSELGVVGSRTSSEQCNEKTMYTNL